MPRLMSVSLTEPQVRARTKTVTRRLGWLMLKTGDRLTLCRKVMGRKPGEPVERITDVEVLSVHRERLDSIPSPDLAAEGFPEMTSREFAEFFCSTHKGCTPETVVTRIEWRYLSAYAVLDCGTEEDAAKVAAEADRPSDPDHSARQEGSRVIIRYHDKRYPLDVASWAFEAGYASDAAAANTIARL